jgi:membrane protein
LLLVLSLFGSIAADDADRSRVLSFVFRYFPTRIDFLTNQLDAFRSERLQIGLAGGAALIWASLGVFGAVTTAVNEAWGVEKQRSFWTHRLVSFLMLVAAGGATLVALLFVSFLQVAEASWFGQVLASFGWLATLQSFVFRYLATLLLMFGLGLIFYFVPNARTRLRDVWVGAILTGLLWRTAFALFSLFLGTSTRLTMIHGSITTVVVFLMWVYASSVILMYGVEFTAAHARLRHRTPDGAPAAPALEG